MGSRRIMANPPWAVSVVIDDFGIMGVSVDEAKTKPPSAVDPDAVLTVAVAAQGFETVPGGTRRKSRVAAASSCASLRRPRLRHSQTGKLGSRRRAVRSPRSESSGSWLAVYRISICESRANSLQRVPVTRVAAFCGLDPITPCRRAVCLFRQGSRGWPVRSVRRNSKQIQEQRMSIRHIDREAVEKTIRESDRHGPEVMFARYDGSPSTCCYVRFHGKHYDQKLPLRAAHGLSGLGPLPVMDACTLFFPCRCPLAARAGQTAGSSPSHYKTEVPTGVLSRGPRASGSADRAGTPGR